MEARTAQVFPREVSCEMQREPSCRPVMYVSRASRSAESCTLQLADNVVAFLHDEAVEAGAAVRAGDTVVHRCQDIGKFVFTGSVRRRCEAGPCDEDRIVDV